jgi:hypothetical protein
MTAVANVSETFMLADSKVSGYVSNQIGAPASLWDPYVCTYSNWGWGSEASKDGAGVWPLNPTYTGGVAPNHTGGMNVVRVDSSTKFYKPGNLAAGTTWQAKTMSGANIMVTSYAKYVWDTRE